MEEKNWLKRGRTLEGSLLDFNTAWANTLDTMVKQYRVTVELGKPVREIPSQLIRPIYGRFLKNIVEESPIVSTELGLGNQKGAMYYTEDAKISTATLGEHPLTSTAMIQQGLCCGKVKLVDYMFQPFVRMSKAEDSQYLGEEHVRGEPTDEWFVKPFTRYVDAKFPSKIYTWQKEEVNIEQWTWTDHIEKVIKPHVLWNHLYSKSNFSN